MAETPEPAPPADPIAAAVAGLRTTTKWLMGVLGAIGTALIVGVQLTPLGALSWSDPRLAIGGVAFVVALLGVARLLQLAGAVLAPDTTNLDDLANWVSRRPARERHELRMIRTQLEAQPWLYDGWGRTIGDLHAAYEREVRALHHEIVSNWSEDVADAARSARAGGPAPAPQPGTTTPAAAAGAEKVAEQQAPDPQLDLRRTRRDVTRKRRNAVDNAVGAVVRQAHFLRFKARFAALMVGLVRWGAVIGAAIFVVAWAASPPDEEADAGASGGAGGTEVAVEALDEVVVTLLATAGGELGEALGEGCELAAIPAVVLDRDETSFEVVSVPASGCRAVAFEVTCATGVVQAETTTGSLERIGPRCS